jgi:hypothetical protein
MGCGFTISGGYRVRLLAEADAEELHGWEDRPRGLGVARMSA